VLFFLLVAVFLLAGCGVGTVEAEEKLAIGFVLRLPFPNIQALPEKLFGHLEIPREALTDLSKARVSTALKEDQPLTLFKEISRAPDEATVKSPYEKAKEKAKEEAKKEI